MRQFSSPPQLDPSQWSSEMQILHCCGQARDSAANDEHFRALILGDLDWKRLLGSARIHGMIPLLQAKIDVLDPVLVPLEVREFLRNHCFVLHARGLQFTGELLGLLDCFATHGIQMMPFKGPILASQAYGALTARPYSDLDLLVHLEDVQPACDLLVKRGYTPRYTLSTAQRANLLRFGCEHPFQRIRATGVSHNNPEGKRSPAPNRDDVDLHWNLFPPSFPIAFDSKALWSRIETITVGRREITTIGTDILILYLCAHGYAHHWNRLEWICSLARLISARPKIDWAWIQQEARRTGAERVLELGAVLAGDWMGAPVPLELLAEAHRQPAMQTLLKHVAARIVRDPEEIVLPGSTLNEELFFDLDARENWSRRVSYFLRRLMTPSLEDVEWVSVPAPLSSLYYLLRPVRLSLRSLGSQPQRLSREK